MAFCHTQLLRPLLVISIKLCNFTLARNSCMRTSCHSEAYQIQPDCAHFQTHSVQLFRSNEQHCASRQDFGRQIAQTNDVSHIYAASFFFCLISGRVSGLNHLMCKINYALPIEPRSPARPANCCLYRKPRHRTSRCAILMQQKQQQSD